MKAAVVTVSDGVSAGEREDESGALLVELLEAEHYEVEHRLVPDVRFQIAAVLRELALTSHVILTTGGTGVSPRDFTPEATQSVLDRVVPGIAEALRADAIRKTPHGLLGRGTAGIRGQALIVNLLLLMVVSFLPFATKLLGDYIGEDAPEHKAELSGRA